MASKSEKCVKCGEDASGIIGAQRTKDDTLCRKCLFENVKYKTKFSITKAFPKHSKSIGPFALGLSGSVSSLCLLEILAEAYKPLPPGVAARTGCFQIVLAIHVFDEEEEKEEQKQAIVEITSRLKVPLKVINLRNEPYFQYISQIVDNSAQETVKNIVIQKILARETISTGLKILVTAESGSKMASLVISNTCEGRGSIVSTRTALIDSETYSNNNNGNNNTQNQSTSLSIVRPLRDILDEDISVAASFYNINIQLFEKHQHNQQQSVFRVCSNFMNQLQQNFPHVYHTVLGSSSRLIPELKNNKQQCRFCKCFLTISDEPVNGFCHACSVLSSSFNIPLEKFE